MPSEEEILAIEKAFRFKGLFDQHILDILKLMPEEQQNAKRANLAIFKQGERGGQLWRDYEAAGHNHKQLSSQISRILTKEKKENERKAAEGAAEGAAGHGAADSENEEGEDEQDLVDPGSEQEEVALDAALAAFWL